MILPGWVAPVGIGMALIASHWFAYGQGVTAESTRQQLAITGAALAGQLAARGVEQVQAKTTIEAVKNAQTELSAVPDVRPELDRLRDQTAALRRELSSTADAAKRGEAATKAAMVLSELLDRSAARNVELARRYDESVTRGQLCERLSDAWRDQQANAQ